MTPSDPLARLVAASTEMLKYAQRNGDSMALFLAKPLAEALAACEAAQPGAGAWIACSERMPEDDRHCLTYDVGAVSVACWLSGIEQWMVRGREDETFTAGSFSHWMSVPIPPPKESP